MKDYLTLGWKLLPWLIAIVFALNWWFRPQPGTSAAGAQVVVAGEEALTKPAKKKWKKRPAVICKSGVPGKPDFKVVLRDPTPAEWERIALEYGLTHGQPAIPEVQSGKNTTTDSSEVLLAQPLTSVFGEYVAPEMRYGGTFLAGLQEDGEFQARFRLNPVPKIRWTNVWGGGARVDITPGLDPTETRQMGFYGFWEPLQVKQFHLRVEPGYFEVLPSTWDFRTLISLEWRAEPWRKKAGKGLVAIPR